MRSAREILECPEGIEEGIWAAGLGLTVGEWRNRLRGAGEDERGMGEGMTMTVSDVVNLNLRVGLAQEIGEEVAYGGRLRDIAPRYGVSAGKLRAWIFGDAERLALYEAGLRGRAEELADEALEFRDKAILIADSADVDEIQVSKLQVDTRFKAAALNMELAARYDPRRFGQDRSMKLEVGRRDEGELQEQLKELLREPEMREVMLRLLGDEGRVIEPEADKGDAGG